MSSHYTKEIERILPQFFNSSFSNDGSLCSRFVVIFRLASGLLRRLERRLRRLRLGARQTTATEAALQTTAHPSLRRGTTHIDVRGSWRKVQVLKTQNMTREEESTERFGMSLTKAQAPS